MRTLFTILFLLSLTLSLGIIPAYAEWVGPDVRIKPLTANIGDEITATCKPSRAVNLEDVNIDYVNVGQDYPTHTQTWILQTELFEFFIGYCYDSLSYMEY